MLSIGISLSKIIAPIGLLLSGALIKVVHISLITMFEAICMFIISVGININEVNVNQQSDECII